MARSGLKATGSVYGYERNEDKALGVVTEAVVVSKIFKLYSQHRSLGKVAAKVLPRIDVNQSWSCAKEVQDKWM